MTTSESEVERIDTADPADASASQPDRVHLVFLDDGTSKLVFPSRDGDPPLVLNSCNNRPLPEGMPPAFG
jgi:hypothetical protein